MQAAPGSIQFPACVLRQAPPPSVSAKRGHNPPNTECSPGHNSHTADRGPAILWPPAVTNPWHSSSVGISCVSDSVSPRAVARCGRSLGEPLGLPPRPPDWIPCCGITLRLPLLPEQEAPALAFASALGKGEKRPWKMSHFLHWGGWLTLRGAGVTPGLPLPGDPSKVCVPSHAHGLLGRVSDART